MWLVVWSLAAAGAQIGISTPGGAWIDGGSSDQGLLTGTCLPQVLLDFLDNQELAAQKEHHLLQGHEAQAKQKTNKKWPVDCWSHDQKVNSCVQAGTGANETDRTIWRTCIDKKKLAAQIMCFLT